MSNLNKIHHIDDGRFQYDLKGYAVFEDTWIGKNDRYLVDPNTKEVFRILDFQYHRKHEWDSPELIQYGAANYREIKRSAVKTDKPLNPAVLYELITNSDWIPNNTWVKCKKNDEIRYVTRQISSVYFEDDGRMSGQKPSPHCYYSNYEPIENYTTV